MRQYTLITILLLMPLSQIMGQLNIQYEDKSLTLHKVNSFEIPILFDSPSRPNDEEGVRVFKSYFNPTSFENYKSFFLPEDWMGLTPSGYQEWQDYIHANRLHLVQTLTLNGPDQVEYLILQYISESPAYTIPASTEFKKVNGRWMHTNVRKDKCGIALSQIGLIHPEFIAHQFATRGNSIDLSNSRSFTSWTYKEKFTRSTLFEPIQKILQSKGINEVDLALLKNYFLLKDDLAFIRHLDEEYHMDHYDLIDEINSSVGFTLFNYTRPQND